MDQRIETINGFVIIRQEEDCPGRPMYMHINHEGPGEGVVKYSAAVLEQRNVLFDYDAEGRLVGIEFY